MHIKWPGTLLTVGHIGLFIGAIDPLEGSVIILAGSILIVLGTYFGRLENPLLVIRLRNCLLVAFGIAALWILSALGGFGGEEGLSGWWGLLILPYVVGWSASVWGAGAPRWMAVAGIAIALWYGVLAVLSLRTPGDTGVAVVAGAISVITFCGCAYRLSAVSKHRVE
jgi:hypothetical protein